MLPSIFGENMFDDFFDEFDREFFGRHNPLYGKRAKNLMKTDIQEHDDKYEVEVDLPGFKKDEIKLDVRDGYLTISAAKSMDKDEKKKGKYIRQERYAGACSRTFYVGDVKPSEIKAKYESGILTLDIPKKDMQVLPDSGHIEIE